MPELCIYKSQTECLMKEKLFLFDSIFSEVHYSVSSNQKLEGHSYIYNPDTILKVQPITVIDRLEYLLGRRRYEEAIELINSQEVAAANSDR